LDWLDFIYGFFLDKSAEPSDADVMRVGFHRELGTGYNTQEARMEFLERYKEACLFAVQDPDLIASDINGDGHKQTKCNFGVQQICEAIGYYGFKGKTANQIYSLLIVDSGWIRSRAAVCMDKLKKGKAIAIAAYEDEPHGHVAMMYPGDFGESGKWESQDVPLVANIGKKNGVMFANYAFGQEPAYFYRSHD